MKFTRGFAFLFILLLVLSVMPLPVQAKGGIRLMWESNAGVCTKPNLADIDNDGELEIIGLFQDLSTEEGLTFISALSGSTGQVKWKIKGQGTACRDYPVMDLDGDGKTEVAAYDGNHLLIISGNGKILNRIKVSQELSNLAAVMGPKGKTFGLLILEGKSVSLLKGIKGKALWTAKLPSTSAFVTLFDIDGDGIQDAIVSCQDRLLAAVNGKNGKIIWRKIHGSGYQWAYTAVLEKGGGKSGLFAAYGTEGDMYLIDIKTGNIEKKYPFKPGLFIPIDTDGDGRMEILGTNGGLFAADPWTGRILWRNPQATVLESPAVYRLEGQKTALVIAADSNQMLGIFSAGDGEPRWRNKIGYNAAYTTPVVGDFNGDGQLEFFAESRAYSLGESGQVAWMGNRGDRAYSGDFASAVRYGLFVSNLQKSVIVDDGFKKIFPADIAVDFVKTPEKVGHRTYKGAFEFDKKVKPALKWRAPSMPDVQGMALDLDNDGKIEFVNVNNGISVMDGATGRVRWRRDLEYCSVPAVATVSGGNESRIFTGDRDGFLYCMSSKNGKVLWKAKTGNRLDFSCPVVADLKKDGRPFVLSVNNGKISLYEGQNGKLAASTPAMRVFGSNVPAVGDLDGDGVDEYCVFDADGILWVFKYPAKVLLKKKIPGRSDNGCPPALADLDGDGAVDIILGGDSLTAFSFRKNKILWQADVKGDSAPALSDLNGDGIADIISSSDSGISAVDGASGKTLFKRVYKELTGKPGLSWTWLTGVPSTADLDGDGIPDIIALQCKEPDKTLDSYYFYQNIHAFRGDNGAPLGKFYYETLFVGSPVLSDSDGDGRSEMIVGLEHPKTGMKLLECFTFPGRGRIYWAFSGGDPKNSRNYTRAIEFSKKLSGKAPMASDADYAAVMKADGVLLSAHSRLIAGDYTGAGDLIDSAFELYRKSSFIQGQILSQVEKGNVCFYTGLMAKALDLLKSARNTAGKLNDDWALTDASSALARIHLFMGNYREAIQEIKTVRELAEKMDSFPYMLSASSLEGRLYLLLKEPEKAVDAFLKAETKGGADVEKASTALELGGYMHSTGQLNDSARMYLKALRLYQKAGRKDGAAETLAGAASLYSSKGYFKESVKLLEKALSLLAEISRKNLAPAILTDMGFSLLNMGQKEKALKCFADSLKLLESREVVQADVQWRAHFGTARVYEASGRDNDALVHYKKAVRIVEELRGQIGSPQLRSRFMEDKFPLYEGIIKLLIKMGRGREAFDYSERAKARAFMDMLKSPRFTGNMKQTGADFNRLAGLQASIASIRSRLNEDPSLASKLGKALREAKEEYEREVSRIRLENPRLSLISGVWEPMDSKEIKNRFINESTAVVEYFTGSDYTVIWIIDSEGLHEPIVKDVGFKSLSVMVSRLRRPLASIASEGPPDSAALAGILNRFSLKNSYDLYRLIFEDADRILEKNGKIKTLIVIPDGPLHFYPLEALVSAEPGSYGKTDDLSDYGKAAYLIKKYAFIYSPSASALDPRLKGSGPSSSANLVALGNPVYVQDNLAKKNSKPKSYTLASADLRSRTFSPLPDSKREIESIGRFFKEKALGSLLLSGRDATEPNARKHMSEGGYLHFSCHGVLEQENPMFSGLALSLDKTGPDTSNDGFLEVFEVFALNLNAKLVVLSACETGLGNYHSGEGVVGLSRAFMYAGAQQVVVSLWSVADESTTDMMEVFYRRMLKNGEKAPRALQQAKLEMLKMKSRKGLSYGHPFFWAPFVLMGKEGRAKSAEGNGAAMLAGGITTSSVMAPWHPRLIVGASGVSR